MITVSMKSHIITYSSIPERRIYTNSGTGIRTSTVSFGLISQAFTVLQAKLHVVQLYSNSCCASTLILTCHEERTRYIRELRSSRGSIHLVEIEKSVSAADGIFSYRRRDIFSRPGCKISMPVEIHIIIIRAD